MQYNFMDLRIGWLLLCDWWKETFYLLPSQLDEKPKEQAVSVSINCHVCAAQHVDEGEWATRLHKTHQCQDCGHEWRPFDYYTVGVK